jgi:tetratricopeptide (TPR) repeat protein
MKRAAAIVLLFLFTLALHAQEGGGQTQSGQQRSAPATHVIRGRVYMPDGFPAQNQMRVTLRTLTQAVVQESFTDSVGNFEFRNVPGGTYEIVVWGTEDSDRDSERIETAVEKIEIISRVARTFSANIFLRSKPDEPGQRPTGGVVSMSQLDPNIPKSARKEYERAVKESQKGSSQTAIEHFERAVTLYPKYFQALNDLGVQYSRNSRFAEAEATFGKATALDPKAPFPYFNLGYMRLNQKLYDEAVEVLNQGVALDAANWAGHMWLGVALMETKKYEPSREHLEKAVSLGPPGEVAAARLYLANLFIRMGDLTRAIDASEQYLREAPKAENAGQVKEKITQMRSLLEKQGPGASSTEAR